ncbi:MAG TPA: hypothetical protein ENK57_24010 [Polyangiaceae bacterium]|nr:hypothetical protein [Polyangiaceae bacterium]
MRGTAIGVITLVLGLGVGCAPADVAGSYTVNVTNGENGCAFDNWTVGETASSIPIVVAQTDDQVQLDVGGTSGAALDIFIGSSIFNGQVSGSGVTAALVGSRSATMGMCTYTVTVDMDATSSGDLLEGQLIWRPVTNMHADCGVLNDCRSLQSFNGTRPPP